VTFVAQETTGDSHRSGARSATFLAERRRVRASEPCRVTMCPALANGFIVGTGREHRVKDPR